MSISYHHNTSDYLAYLTEDGNLFFIELTALGVSILQKLSAVQVDSFGNMMFPANILEVDLDQDRRPELLLEYKEAGEASVLFKLALFKPNFTDKTLELLFETDPLFPFPSYSPFVKPKPLRVEDDRVVVPYCVGCEAGEEGQEATGVLRYTESGYTFER